jgi:hypothetical protein
VAEEKPMPVSLRPPQNIRKLKFGGITKTNIGTEDSICIQKLQYRTSAAVSKVMLTKSSKFRVVWSYY